MARSSVSNFVVQRLLDWKVNRVFGYPGDGAMQMLGITNLITVAKYWRQWEDPRLVVLILNNHDLAQVTWEMRAMEGDPKFEASQNIPDMDYARFAKNYLSSTLKGDAERLGFIRQTIRDVIPGSG